MNFSKSSDSPVALDEREDKFVKVGLLLDYYESVLSKKQFDTLDMYYNQDMSLSEIGETLGITRQGVYEILKRGEKRLFELEEKLHCHELTVACDGLRKALLRVSVLKNKKNKKNNDEIKNPQNGFPNALNENNDLNENDDLNKNDKASQSEDDTCDHISERIDAGNKADINKIISEALENFPLPGKQ